MKIYGVTKEHICPWCGKKFYIPYQSKGGGRTQWTYKLRLGNKRYYYCSYSCSNHAKDVIEQVKEQMKEGRFINDRDNTSLSGTQHRDNSHRNTAGK